MEGSLDETKKKLDCRSRRDDQKNAEAEPGSPVYSRKNIRTKKTGLRHQQTTTVKVPDLSAVTPMQHSKNKPSYSCFVPSINEEAALPDAYFSQAKADSLEQETASDADTYFSETDIIESSQPTTIIKANKNETAFKCGSGDLNFSVPITVQSQDDPFMIESQISETDELGSQIPADSISTENSVPAVEDSQDVSLNIAFQYPESCQDNSNLCPDSKENSVESLLVESQDVSAKIDSGYLGSSQTDSQNTTAQEVGLQKDEIQKSLELSTTQSDGAIQNSVLNTKKSRRNEQQWTEASTRVMTRNRMSQSSQSNAMLSKDTTRKTKKTATTKKKSQKITTIAHQTTKTHQVKLTKKEMQPKEKKAATKTKLQPSCDQVSKSRKLKIEQQNWSSVTHLQRCLQVVQQGIQNEFVPCSVTQVQADIKGIQEKVETLKPSIPENHEIHQHLKEILQGCDLVLLQLHYVPHFSQPNESRSAPSVKKRVLSFHSQPGKSMWQEMSLLPSLQQLLSMKVLLPGHLNIKLLTNDGVDIVGSLNEMGDIQTPDGYMFASPEEWCTAMCQQNELITRNSAYRKITYNGESLFSIATKSCIIKSGQGKAKTARKKNTPVVPGTSSSKQDQNVTINMSTNLTSAPYSETRYFGKETQIPEDNYCTFEEAAIASTTADENEQPKQKICSSNPSTIISNKLFPLHETVVAAPQLSSQKIARDHFESKNTSQDLSQNSNSENVTIDGNLQFNSSSVVEFPPELDNHNISATESSVKLTESVVDNHLVAGVQDKTEEISGTSKLLPEIRKVTEVEKVNATTEKLAELNSKSHVVQEINGPDSVSEEKNQDKGCETDPPAVSSDNENPFVRGTEEWRNAEKAKALKMWKARVLDWSTNPQSIHRESLRMTPHPVFAVNIHARSQLSQNRLQNNEASQDMSTSMKNDTAITPCNTGNSNISEPVFSQEIIESSQDKLKIQPPSSKKKQPKKKQPTSVQKPRQTSAQKSRPVSCKKIGKQCQDGNTSDDDCFIVGPTVAPEKSKQTGQTKYSTSLSEPPVSLDNSQDINSVESVKRNLGGAWSASFSRFAAKLKNARLSQNTPESSESQSQGASSSFL